MDRVAKSIKKIIEIYYIGAKPVKSTNSELVKKISGTKMSIL